MLCLVTAAKDDTLSDVKRQNVEPALTPSKINSTLVEGDTYEESTSLNIKQHVQLDVSDGEAPAPVIPYVYMGYQLKPQIEEPVELVHVH
ncbi:hypothetical protein VNO77_14549 [Canavalia gladiata]|uniref:Uncharacterized protein n=1 Tax=Canavalia gladiata TaxID=3824 RepID=A0AAN9M3K7_CANGL